MARPKKDVDVHFDLAKPSVLFYIPIGLSLDKPSFPEWPSSEIRKIRNGAVMKKIWIPKFEFNGPEVHILTFSILQSVELSKVWYEFSFPNIK